MFRGARSQAFALAALLLITVGTPWAAPAQVSDSAEAWDSPLSYQDWVNQFPDLSPAAGDGDRDEWEYETTEPLPEFTLPSTAEILVPSAAPRPDSPDESKGFDGMGGFGGMERAGGAPFYSTSWFPGQDVSDQESELASVDQNMRVAVPIWRNGADIVLMNIGVNSVLYDTTAVFPESSTPFPEHIWGANLGTMYSHRFENGWNGGLMLNVGSVSDQPFESLDEFTFGMGAFLRVPSGERNAWRFSLMYSPLSEIPFPLPGVSYQWQVSDSFRMNLGAPLQINWRPLSDVFVDASYVPLTRVHFQTGWRVGGGPVTVFGGFDWTNETYLLADRVDDQDRLSGYAQILSAGLRYDGLQFGTLELAGGYAFDRFYFIGQGYGERNTDRIDVDPSAFLGANFNMGF